jgi:hypothetical protein
MRHTNDMVDVRENSSQSLVDVDAGNICKSKEAMVCVTKSIAHGARVKNTLVCQWGCTLMAMNNGHLLPY